MMHFNATVAFCLSFVGMSFPVVGDKGPPLSLTKLSSEPDQPLKTEDLIGDPLLMEFWATWCTPCEEARLHLIKLQENLGPGAIQILAISNERPEKIKKFMKTHSMPYMVATDCESAAHIAYSISSIPSAVLIDRKGLISWIGDPRTLNTEDVRAFVATGSIAASAPHQEAAKANMKIRSKFAIDVFRSTAKKESRTGIGYGGNSRGFSFQCQEKSLRTIINSIKDLSATRFPLVEGASLGYYNIIYERTGPCIADLDGEIILRTVCAAAKVELAEKEEERDVWVVSRTPGGRPLPRSLQAPEQFSYENGRYVGTGISWPKFVSAVETESKVYIDDETSLADRYDISFPVNVDFGEMRNHISNAYGVQFRSEKRLTKIYHLQATDSN